MPPRFVAEQLSHHRGFGGWLVRRGMNRGNARLNAFALAQLDLQPTDTVLQVGFGGGLNIRRILDHGASVTLRVAPRKTLPVSNRVGRFCR